MSDSINNLTQKLLKFELFLSDCVKIVQLHAAASFIQSEFNKIFKERAD